MAKSKIMGNKKKNVVAGYNSAIKRLLIIKHDIELLYANLPENILDKKVQGYGRIGTLVANIGIASDITDNESDSWSVD